MGASADCTPSAVGPTWKATLILFALVIPGCGHGRSGANKAHCLGNLRTLYDALVTYSTQHHDVPRQKDGRASLDPLIGSLTLQCPAAKDGQHAAYVLNAALTVDDLRRGSKTIVACDQLPNHIDPITHNPVRMVLVGNGATAMMDLPLKEQEEWWRLFVADDERAGSISLREGANEAFWSSADILWYVGPEKGYVPNGYVPDRTSQ